MPAIVIKDHRWRQTEKKIIICVPFKGHPKNVDLFVMDNYVKISFPPFFLELFLWENVVEEQSECTLTDTEAIFSLLKANVASNWPCLEMGNINKEEKRDLRNRILEKTWSVLENRAKFKSEKRQQLQKEAVKAQINLNTETLNKIESLRDAYRKIAMRDFEKWRSNAEIPILQNIPGELQKNRKNYRPPLKWFKDDSGNMQSLKLNEKEDTKEIKMAKKKISESIVIEGLNAIEENMKGKSFVQSNLKKQLINNDKAKLKEKIDIEQQIKKKLTIEENQRRDLSNETSLKTISNENLKKKTNILQTEKNSITSVNINFTKSSSCFENSEVKLRKSLQKEMDQKSLQRFYVKGKKQKPDQELIDKVLKGRYFGMNQIFNEPAKTIPLPRKSGTINVTFSKRVFPTPARESYYLEEQEWLSKQAEARRKTGFAVEDLRPEEQDPQWLKDKGNDFFKAGNYLAAISAYSHGIKISDKMATLYVNRSAAHYALGNYYRCIDDCSKVLELMEPKCESNRISRARCHARRGAALCKLSTPQHGIPELEAALKLDPNNEGIRRDLQAARQYFNMNE